MSLPLLSTARHFHHGCPTAAAAVAAPAPTSAATLEAEDARARATLLALVEPADQPLALIVMDDAAAAVKAQRTAEILPKHAEAGFEVDSTTSTGSHTPTLLFSSSPSSPLATYCNAFLCGLARAHAPPLLDKTFAYLGKMRALSPEDLGDGVVPSPIARNKLIRTCAVVIRGVGLDGIEGGGHHHQHQQHHPSSSRARSQAIYTQAESKKYIGLGEMLFEEYLQSAHEAIRRQPNDKYLLSTYQTDTPPLLSSTIYLYCQARERSKAITLFQRMREQSFPCPINPDAWAASGVVRAQAHYIGPLEGTNVAY